MAIRRVPATPELAARVRAARGYGAISSQEKLGDAIGVGKQTIVRIEAADMEQGVRVAWLEQIAKVAGLPYEFFTAPFDRLADETRGGQLGEMNRRLEAIMRHLGIDLPKNPGLHGDPAQAADEDEAATEDLANDAKLDSSE